MGGTRARVHLDWIHAAIDGDGRREHVPHVDRVGPRAPDRSHLLFSTGSPAPEPGETGRFFLDGDSCDGWSAVPERYKAPDFGRPEPGRRAVRLFTFTW